MPSWSRCWCSVLLTTAMLVSGSWAGATPPPARVSPPKLPPAAAIPEAGASYVRIPVRLPVEVLRSQVEQRIPVHVIPAADFAPYEKNVQVRYAIVRDSVDAVLNQNEVQLGAKLLYWLETRTPDVAAAGCGSASAPIPVRVAWKVRCGWQDGWRLDTRTTILPTVFSLRCKPVPPSINFTAFLNRTIDERVVLPVAAALDSLIQSRTDLRSKLEAAWRSLGEPIDLGGAGWLSWQPEAAIVEPIQSAGDGLVSHLAIVARPRVTAGARPSYALPPLPDTKVRLAGEDVLVAMKFEIPMEEVNARLAGAAPAGTKMRVSGSGARVVITCEAADAKAEPVYFVGDVAYDPATYRLAVRGLEPTPESQAAVAAGRASGVALDLQQIQADVVSALTFDLGPRISAGLVLLGHGINRQLTPGVSMRGGAMEQNVLATYVTDTVFGLRLAARGQATLQIE